MTKFFCVVPALLLLAAASTTAGEYEIVIKSGRIADSKADGAGWDAIGAPDPYVKGGIQTGQETVESLKTTRTAKDTYRPFWNQTFVTADIGDDILLQVWDEDVLKDDPIGQFSFSVTNSAVLVGEQRVRFDQVLELYIIIRKAR